MKEDDVGIKHETSALENFLDKYVIEGKPRVIPFDYFKDISSQLKDFMRNHRNIKTLMIMIVNMEKMVVDKKVYYIQDKTYAKSLKKTDVKKLPFKMLYEILSKISAFSKKWFRLVFKRSCWIRIIHG